MREKSIENYLQAETARLGGMCEKWGVNGWPDRIVIIPAPIDNPGPAIVGFAELKRPGKTPERRQGARIRSLEAVGAPAGYLDTHEAVQAFLGHLLGLVAPAPVFAPSEQ